MIQPVMPFYSRFGLPGTSLPISINMSWFSCCSPLTEGFINEKKQNKKKHFLISTHSTFNGISFVKVIHTQCMSFICHTATFILIDFCFCLFVCFPLVGLAGPCVARLLSCPSLNIARQSTEPWASSSTKVKLHLLTHTHSSSPLHPRQTNIRFRDSKPQPGPEGYTGTPSEPHQAILLCLAWLVSH